MTALTARALMFDMDGTIVDSSAAIVRVWTRFADAHGLDAVEVVAACHGVRMIETIRRFAPHVDHDAVAADLTAFEIDDLAGIVEIPGARDLWATLPLDRVAIVTSAAPDLARARLAAVGLAEPRVIVDATMVPVGKPDPAPYLLGASLLGVSAAETIVFEDAPAGIASGLAAGAEVVVIGGAGGDASAGLPRIRDYTGVRVAVTGAGITLAWD